MKYPKLDEIKKKRNELASQIEKLFEDFTEKTSYHIDKITVEYAPPKKGIFQQDPTVTLSIKTNVAEDSDKNK